MGLDKNGKAFEDGQTVIVTTAEETFSGTVIGLYQDGDKEGSTLPHVEHPNGARSMPAGADCEIV